MPREGNEPKYVISIAARILGCEIHTLRYCYLEGTAIAGSTTYFVEPRAGHRCLVRQVLEYQEINGLAMAVFQRCLLYTSPSPRDRTRSRMPSSA